MKWRHDIKHGYAKRWRELATVRSATKSRELYVRHHGDLALGTSSNFDTAVIILQQWSRGFSVWP